MHIEQFVMAYAIEQDRIRALLPPGFESLRPVLRINTEIRDERSVYVEFNTPVAHDGKRGWVNIGRWESTEGGLHFERNGKRVTIEAPFFFLIYEGVGKEGGCPAERDNDGCFFPGEMVEFRPAEKITSNKEFCDCEFAWRFHDGDACGKSIGKTLPAFKEEAAVQYEKQALTAEHAAAIPCKQILGSYIVRFER